MIIYTEEEIMELFPTLEIYGTSWEDLVCVRRLIDDHVPSYGVLGFDDSLDVRLIKGKSYHYYRTVDLINILNNKYDGEHDKKYFPDLYVCSIALVDFLFHTELNKVPLYITVFPQIAKWRLKISK